MDKATAKSLTPKVDLLETKSAQSTELYLGVSASGSLACIQTLFYFSFRSFQKHQRARENPFALAVNKSPEVYFLLHALDGL